MKLARQKLRAETVTLLKTISELTIVCAACTGSSIRGLRGDQGSRGAGCRQGCMAKGRD